MVISSVVQNCAAEWYRLGRRLGYNGSQLKSMTFDISTPEGKLEAIIERKCMKEGTDDGKVVEALLDACDQLIPLAIVSVMEDLRIEYTVVSDHLLYEVGKRVGQDWKVVGRHLGLTAQDIADVKQESEVLRDGQGRCCSCGILS